MSNKHLEDLASSGGGGGDGAIVDGASSAIKATVRDYTNSNPLAVTLTDTNGDPASIGAGTQYTEDVAAAADPVGTMAMAVRLDTLAAITSTDGDNIAIRATNKGEQYVKHVDAIPVTDNAGSLTVDGSVSLAAAIPAGTNNIGDVDVLTLPALPAGTNNIGDVDVLTLPALPAGTNNIGDVDVLTLPSIPAGTNNIGDVDVLTMPNVRVHGIDAHDATITGDPLLCGFKSSAAAPADVTADNEAVRGWALRNGSQVVNLAAGGTLIPGTANGLGVQQATASNLNAQVVGSIAHDSADSGNPVKVGGFAANALPTAVANADRVNALADLFGRLLTTSIDPAMQVSRAFNATSTQTGTDVWDPAGGKKIAVTALMIGTYGTTAARVILWFGDNADTTYTAGTDQVLFAGSFAPSATVKPGMVINFDPPVYCTTADRELHITTDAGISIDVTVYGFEW